MSSFRMGAPGARRILSRRNSPLLSLVAVLAVSGAAAQTAPADHSAPVKVFVYDRTRVDNWKWFGAPPYQTRYTYVQTLQRLGMTQRLRHWDWELELAQPSVLGAPDNAVSSSTAQGQLGVGGTYYASNGNNSYPAAVFFKEGFARLDGEEKNLRIGRFEYFDGDETKPGDPTLAWLQTNRISNRLISNFAFTNAQRSFDGLDGQMELGSWNLTAMAARADQGVFNMNGNPQIDVDVQYLAVTHPGAHQHLLWRAFAIGYHDGRTGIAKTDNRPLPVRTAEHSNIRIGTYGGNLTAVVPAGTGQFDLLFWGALQNGRWGSLDHRAGAAALEGGYRFGDASWAPWLRGGWFRSSGDKDPSDGTHNTFFQLLPTPRLYARLPFYNLMNSTDSFVQLIERPVPRLTLRSDLHWLSLTSGQDLWYQGGGAFDNKVFGFSAHPGNGLTSFASVPDISADWQTTKTIGINFYYAYAQGKSVVASSFPSDRNMQFGYVEFVYHWSSGTGSGRR